MSSIANAIDEARERLSAAQLHTPGGVLTKDERDAILRSTARAHGLPGEHLYHLLAAKGDAP